MVVALTMGHAAWAAQGPLREKPPRAGSAQSHKFSDLRLKGRLKKPEMSYIYKRNGLRAEKIVDIPENFDNEIIQDASRF